FIGTLLLLVAVIIGGGGLSNLFADLMEINLNLVTPFGDDGSLSASYVSSYWFLVGVGVIGLPQIAVWAMSYKDSNSMHWAILIGTVVVGVIMLGMHMIGAFGQPILPGIDEPDKVIPELALEV